MSFYRGLFTAPENLDVGAILQHVQRKVTEAMNDSLTRTYTSEEIRRAVFMMGPNKSPGPDGLTDGFFQLHWDLVGPQVCEAVLHFLNGSELPDDINITTIVLIPKCKNPVEMKHFRPDQFLCVMYCIKSARRSWPIDFESLWMKLYLRNRVSLCQGDSSQIMF